MKRELNIDQLMTETWLTVSLLRQGAITQDGSTLYDKCINQVESVRNELQRAGYDEASIEHITYAQCALLDEAVMGRKSGMMPDRTVSEEDEGQLFWRRAPLQARFFGSLDAGEALWERIAEVLRQPAPVNCVILCFHRVIALGFQGLYGVKLEDQSQREEVVKALSERVTPPDAGLSLLIHQKPKYRYNLVRSVWFWIVLAAAVTGVVWWGGYLWLQRLLSTLLAELPQ